jgi:MFS family permease
MFRQLLSTVGFPWAVRSIAFVIFATYLLSYPILFYQPAKSPLIRRWIDISAFTDWAFLFAVLGAMLSSMAYYLPMLYLPLFAETGVPGLANGDPDLAFYLVSIANGASVVGRLLAGLIATGIGPIETCSLAVACSSVVLFCWIAVKSIAGVIVWSAIWGLVSSVIVAMPGAMIPLLSPSLAVIGTRTGMYWAGVGIGVLIGSPIAGALIDIQSPEIRWWHLQVFAGVFMGFGALCSIYPLIYVRRKRRALATSF